MFDSHIHTKISTDSKMNIEDAIKKANKKDLGLILTEHMDYNYPVEGMFVFDIDKYFQQYSKYRGDKLLLGIEMGLRDDCVNEINTTIDGNEFDYVIGSIHAADYIDLYSDEYYVGKSREEALIRYLKDMINCTKIFDCFDSLGHLDYISRYARYEDKEIHYEEFKEYIDEVLRNLINKGKSIEINTRRLGNKIAIENLIKIYKRYSELGGKYVTIGSDAHNIEAIGSNFNVAKNIMDICNLKAVYFKNRKVKYMDI